MKLRHHALMLNGCLVPCIQLIRGPTGSVFAFMCALLPHALFHLFCHLTLPGNCYNSRSPRLLQHIFDQSPGDGPLSNLFVRNFSLEIR